jgi:hypothetical protein
MNEAADGFAAARSARDVIAGLEAMMTEYLWKRPRENLCMWTEISSEATRSDAINRNSRRIYAFIQQSLTEVLVQGIANGTLRKGLDSVRVSMLTNAVFEGLMLRRAIAADFDPRPSISLYFAFLRAELEPALSTRKNTRGARK